jgi:uncharacterized phiE125 gp8 family phage protein
MRMPVRVTPAATPLVDVATARAQARIETTAEDALVQGYINAAMAYIDGNEGITGRCVQPQTWREEFGGWGTHRLALRDVSAVTALGFDAEGDEVAAETTTWVEGPGGAVVTTSGPPVVRVQVTYTCTPPAEVTAVAKQAVLLMVAHWAANREAVAPGGMPEIPFGVHALIGSKRTMAV